MRRVSNNRVGRLIVGAAILAVVVWWTHSTAQPTGESSVHGEDVAAQTSDAALSIAAGQQKWYGQPLYRLENLSKQTLRTVQVFSWSNEALPLLWKGAALPANPQQAPQSVRPPVDLEPGQTVWFELGEAPPQTVTVMWLQGGHSVYENVSIP